MIIIVEHQFKGFQHLEINSGILYILRKKYPDHKLFLLADYSHLLNIKEKLKANGINDGIEYERINILPVNIKEYRRFFRDFLLFYKIFIKAKKKKAKKFFCFQQLPLA